MSDQVIRIPPQAVEAESAVLGAIMLDNSILRLVAPMIAPADFYKPAFQTIYSEMLALDATESPIDIVTLSNNFRAKGLTLHGGLSTLADLTTAVPSVVAAAHYAQKIAEAAKRRAIIHAAYEMAENLYGHEDTDTVMEAFDSKLASIHKNDTGAAKIGTGLGEVMADLENVFKGKEPDTLKTGFPDIDRRAPICPGDFVLIGGRPGMGKTALGLNVAINSATLHDVPTLFISVEMPKKQIIQRAISAISGMDAAKFRRGGLVEKDFIGINRAMSKLSTAPLWIFDRGMLTPQKVCAEISRCVRVHGIRMVVLDHIHQLTGRGTRLEVISSAAHLLKSNAVSNQIAIIGLCQLNRAVEARMPPKPGMGDLKESGELEQAADSVWLLYRQDYYDGKGFFDGKEKKFLRPDLVGKGFVGIDKNRHGPEGYALLKWDGATTSFTGDERY